MLEGKELEGKIGDVGSYYVDIDESGMVMIGADVVAVTGEVEVKSANTVKVPLLVILEKAAAKTSNTWDDAIIAKLKELLVKK